jgi:hypothetical protein
VEDASGHLTVRPVAVSALVVLARCLPGNSEPDGDFRPPDAQTDRVVDQRCQFCFRLVPCHSGALDPLKYLDGRQAGNPLPRTCRFRRRLVLPIRLAMSAPRTRIQDVAQV